MNYDLQAVQNRVAMALHRAAGRADADMAPAVELAAEALDLSPSDGSFAEGFDLALALAATTLASPYSPDVASIKAILVEACVRRTVQAA